MKTIYVLSSTHWDREWYQTYEEYRARLVRMVDGLLDVLEEDPEFRCFHFDGQTVFLQDYLEIRPENETRLKRLIGQKRILIGPWYTMPDEFLVSGESLVRNLKKGAQICRSYGTEPQNCGYVCDIFGHNSQLPQILQGFGISSAALFRGRSGYEKDNFVWIGADGSEVIVHKLHPDYAYSSFYFTARWPFADRNISDGSCDAEIVEKIKGYLAKEEKNFVTGNHLMIDGVDHMDVCKDTPRLLKLLGKEIGEYRFIQSDLSDYTQAVAAHKDKMERASGCLYEVGNEGINNSLLKNVLSSVIALKQSNDECETQLALNLEPLSFFAKTLRMAGGRIGYAPYGGYLDKAWDYLLQNHAHDSICGCSVTEVHQDNLYRFKHAKELAQLVKKDLFACLSETIGADGRGKDGAIAVFNNTQVRMKGAKKFTFEIEENKHEWNFIFYDKNRNVVPHSIVGHRSRHVCSHEYGQLITFPRFDVFDVVMNVDIPEYGYQTFSYDCPKCVREGKHEWAYDEYRCPNRYIGSMRTGVRTVDNGELVVKINDNGTLDVTVKSTGYRYCGLLGLEDCGDIGDGWNYVKPPFDEEVISGGAGIRILSDTPDYFEAETEIALHIPEGVTIGGEEGLSVRHRSKKRSVLLLRQKIGILRGEKKISVRTEAENGQTCHRLRVVFPTHLKTDTFRTSIPFDVYEWPVAKKDASHTKETDTYVNPNQGMVSLSDGKNSFTVYNKGLYEVSVSDREDRAVFLTLFRSFPHETSKVLFGGEIGKEENKTVCAEFCMDFEPADNNRLMQNANAFKVGLQTFSVRTGKAELPAEASYLRIEGGAVLSSLRMSERKDGETLAELRIYDTGGGSEGRIAFAAPLAGVEERDLALCVKKGTIPVEQNSFRYSLAPKKIKTFVLRFKD